MKSMKVIASMVLLTSLVACSNKKETVNKQKEISIQFINSGKS